MPKGVLWRQHDIFMSAMGGRPFGAGKALESYAELAEQVRAGAGTRSAMLIPIIVATAPAVGVAPAAAAFISTAAAGFCLTMTSSAKPVAMFADVEGVPTFGSRDLLRLSATLAPVSAVLIGIFALLVWPRLGLDLHLP